MIENPIFIIGSEGSETALMEQILQAHPHIVIPHPPHIMREFAPLLDAYEDLRKEKNFSALLKDVVHFVNRYHSVWAFEVTVAAVRSFVKMYSLYSIKCALYSLYQQQSGKKRWGCTSVNMHRHMGDVLAQHSEPRFIHIKNESLGTLTSQNYNETKLWVEEQHHIEMWKQKFPDKILSLRQQDILANPEDALQKIMSFLGEDVHENQMKIFSRVIEISEHPVQKSSSNSWKKKLYLEYTRQKRQILGA